MREAVNRGEICAAVGVTYDRVVERQLAMDLREQTPRGDIQGLRGFAVLVVVLCHAGLPVPGGFTGVDVFFVISGFVISGLLVRELAHSGRIDFRRFYTRRVRRLLPALTLTVLVTLGLSFLLGSPFDRQQTVTAATGAGALLMIANAVIFLNSGGYFATPPTNNPLLNTWSLSVEEQFYIVFPLILLGLWWWSARRGSLLHGRPRAALATGVALLAAASLVLCIGMSFGLIRLHLTDPSWFAFYSSPTRAWEFAAGCLAFLAVSRGPVLRGASAQAVGLLGWVALVACVFIIRPSDVFPGWIALAPVLATAAVLIAGAEPDTGLVRISGSRIPRWLGDVSYSWYLWHWPLIAFAAMLLPGNHLVPPIAALASLGIAALSLRFVENPLRFNRSIDGRRVVLLAVGCVGSVLVVSAALFLGARNAWWSPGLTSMADQVGAVHRWQQADCNSDVPMGERPASCRWNAEAAGSAVYLVGDSHAGQLSEAALGAAEALGRPVIVGTKGACPFLAEDMMVDGRLDTACRTFVSDSLAWLRTQPPGDVVLANAVGYLTMPSVALPEPDGTWSLEPANKEQSYLRALGTTVDALTSAGHRVHVLLPIPGFPTTLDSPAVWYPSQCSTATALASIADCGRARSLADVVAETAALEDSMRTVVQSHGGDVIDLRDHLCADGVCATNDGDYWRYLDGTHLSVGQSAALAPVLESSLGG